MIKYAAPTGSDTAAGTEAAPYKTVGKLLGALAPGDTGVLRAGVYTGNVTVSKGGTSGNPITLTSYPGEVGTIKGTLYTKVPYVTFERIKVDGTGVAAVTVQVFGDYNTFDGCEITNGHQGESGLIIGEYEGTYAKSVVGTRVVGCRIHDSGKLSNGQHDHGIYVASSRDAQISGNTITGIEGGWGIQLWTDSQASKIHNNKIDDCVSGSLIIAGGEGKASSNNDIFDNVLGTGSDAAVTSYWGQAPGTGNTVRSNSIALPAFGETAGYTQANNKLGGTPDPADGPGTTPTPTPPTPEPGPDPDPSNAQLRDQAVAELKLTTVGYINKKWKVPPPGTRWANALELLAKIK